VKIVGLFWGRKKRKQEKNLEDFEIKNKEEYLRMVEEIKRREKDIQENTDLLLEPEIKEKLDKLFHITIYDKNTNRVVPSEDIRLIDYSGGTIEVYYVDENGDMIYTDNFEIIEEKK